MHIMRMWAEIVSWMLFFTEIIQVEHLDLTIITIRQPLLQLPKMVLIQWYGQLVPPELAVKQKL